MDSFEHIMIRTVDGGPGRTFEVTPRPHGLDVESWDVGREGTLALLNQLGAERWQLVSADFDAGVYWMKRVIDLEAGSQLY